MKSTKPRSRIWLFALIIGSTLGMGLIVATLLRPSPSHVLQKLGFSDSLIGRIRWEAKTTRFRWSIDDRHPSYYRATRGAETNHVVPDLVARNVSAFVRKEAIEKSRYSLRSTFLRHALFYYYGKGFVLPLPDGKKLYTYHLQLAYNGNFTISVIVQIYDPDTKKVSAQPLILRDRSIGRNDIVTSPDDEHGLIRISRLRSSDQYEIALRQIERGGTDVFDRYYTYHRVDPDLNLRPVIKQLEQCYRIASTWVDSTIERDGSNQILMKFTARAEPNAPTGIAVGWKRFQWNDESKTFDLIGSRNFYKHEGLDWILNNKIFPELAPPETNQPHASWPQPFPPATGRN